MLMKTSELTEAALDWAVAKCEGLHREDTVWEVWASTHQYSSDWSLGGPILEREDISFRKYHNPTSEAHGKYYARICRESGTLIGWYKTTGHQMTGQTPLIAAMRCYVASKFGVEVDVPEELTC